MPISVSDPELAILISLVAIPHIIITALILVSIITLYKLALAIKSKYMLHHGKAHQENEKKWHVPTNGMFSHNTHRMEE